MPAFRRSLPLAAALAVVVAACTSTAPPAGDAPATPAATPAAAAPGPYDPKSDPLVNPAWLFEPAPADPAAMATDETLVRNVDGNPGSLNPVFFTSRYEAWLNSVLFEAPFTFDAKMNWMVNERMTEAFEESPDHLVWTVKLRDGLRWQDGAPFTATDVCWSWEQILDERVPCPAVRAGTDEIANCEVLDPRTYRLTHKQALPTSKWNALFPIIPKHLYEKDKKANPDLKSGEWYAKLNRAPVGNGPYKFVKWVENDKIEVERWEEFPGPKPAFKRMVFRIIPDSNVMMLTFNKGDIDEFRLTAKQFATQSTVGTDFEKMGVKLLSPEWDFSYIVWNQDGSNPFFGDARVRRAMTMATDIERMIRDLAYNLYTPAYGVFHPDSPWFNPEVKRLPFDLEAAGRLLDEAGWVVDDAREGWRHKVIDGKPVKFEFTLSIPQAASISIDLAAILQEDLRSIGIDMKTRVIEWATFSEQNRKHEFQASIAAWGTGTDPDTSDNIWKSDQYDKEGRFGRNYGGYSNKRVDELYDLGKREFDHEKRRTYYQEIQKLIYDDQPYTFLWNRGTTWAMAKRLRGVTTGPRGIFAFEGAETSWWVPAAMQKYPAETP